MSARAAKRRAAPQKADPLGTARALLGKSQACKELLASLATPVRPPPCGGVTGSLVAFLLAFLRASRNETLLLLLPGEEEARGVFHDLEQLLPEEALVPLPLVEDDLSARLRGAARLAAASSGSLVVSSLHSVLDPLPTVDVLHQSRLELRVGKPLSRDALIGALVQAGLEREGTVERAGCFCVKGDVVDFFAEGTELPLRAEFLGNLLEGLRRFDPCTQLSVERCTSVQVSLLGGDFEAWQGALPDLLPQETLLVERDPLRIQEALATHLSRFGAQERAVREGRFEALKQFRKLPVTSLKAPARGALNLGGRVVAARGTSFEEALLTRQGVRGANQHTLLGFDTLAEGHRFLELLSEQPGGDLKERCIHALPFCWHQGFHAPRLGLAALNHGELFALPRRRREQAAQARIKGRPLDSFLELQEGDYVVHLAHGIARFEGLRRELKGGAPKDFLVLRFKDNVCLYVPAIRIHMVEKYLGGRGETPELSRLGGRSWKSKKEAAARAVDDLAAELLELQAERQQEQGLAHPPDTPWQQEFEAAFPFVLTRDQAETLEAIKHDMESPRPMDRLVCGDVGFGKTEVAMRAAFKCVLGGRQVALLVPTTILAQQHLETFQERMQDYPVEIQSLSRFRTRKEQQEVLGGLLAGAVDIVIGTHRLVQDDVRIRNLGLLIIDEEQRFGVVHKEKLRHLRRHVDVLTLSATPIPRTLHQALLGIRDISSLSQAPLGRRAVKTEVTPFDEQLIRQGVLRELDREGQVFFVHNRVRGIHKLVRRLKKLVPEARFLVAHGQMPKQDLKATMKAFLAGRADVLLCTSIIESGLDIPRVNTIFVDEAQRFGLSDLHQLRGRVGRDCRQAYATFMMGQERVISAVAEKRLRAIEEFSDLGSGFQIAMRDMEIRGVGNILGSAQSGHIAAVGYELYCRLLERALRELDPEPLLAPDEVAIQLDFTSFLPETYIPDKRERIALYRRLSRCLEEDDFRVLLEELRDRFGPPPREVDELILLARLPKLLEEAGIQGLSALPEGLVVTARDRQTLLAGSRVRPHRVRLLDKNRLLLLWRAPCRTPAELLSFLEEGLLAMEARGLQR